MWSAGKAVTGKGEVGWEDFGVRQRALNVSMEPGLIGMEVGVTAVDRPPECQAPSCPCHSDLVGWSVLDSGWTLGCSHPLGNKPVFFARSVDQERTSSRL